MKTTTHEQPLRRLADVLHEIALEEDLAEFQAMDAAEVDREIAASGFDIDRVQARIDEALAASRAAASAQASVPAPAKVVDLQAARERRATRWGLLSVAAAAALVLGGTGTQLVATRMPPTTVTYPTSVQPPARVGVAFGMKRDALRACKMGYFAECEEKLDRAKQLWPAVENDPAVAEARAAIKEATSPVKRDPTEPPPSYNELRAKPELGPGERPLQRTP